MRLPFSLLAVVSMLLASACTNRDDPLVAEAGDDTGPIAFERNSEFSGPHLRVFLNLEDGTPVSVDTTDDVVSTRPGSTPLPGHRAPGLDVRQGR